MFDLHKEIPTKTLSNPANRKSTKKTPKFAEKGKRREQRI
jgi:hypothetical protein